MSSPGWIKIHRSLLDHWCAKEPEAIAVWIRLLCEANFEDKKSTINGQLVEVKRGQLIFGLDSFSVKSGVTVKRLRRIMDMLESDGMLGRQRTNKYSIVTITCYDKYQEEAGKGQAKGRQRAAPKEDNNTRSKSTDSASPEGDQQQSQRSVFEMMARTYMDMLPEMPGVDLEANAKGRMTKACNFYKNFKFTPKRWAAYMAAVKECSWMFEDRASADGRTWRKKNFDFLITEKCYLGVREDRYGDHITRER